MEAVLNKKLTLPLSITAIKYCIIMLLMLPLSMFSLYGMRPFGAGFFIALSLLGLPVFITAPMFILGEMAVSFGLYEFLSCFSTVAVMLCVQLIKDKISLKLMRSLTPVFVLLSRCGVFFLLKSDAVLLPLFLSPLLTLGFCYACMCGIRPLLIDKLKYKLLETEIVCDAIVLTAAAAGLSLFSTPYISVFITVAVLSILVSGALHGFSAAAAVGFCFGLGSALTSYDITLASAFLFVAAVSGIFSAAPKVLTASSAALSFVMFVFYFNISESASQSLFNALSAAIGAAIFCFLPKGRLKQFKEFFFMPHERAAVRYMINKNRADIGTRLLGTGSIFLAMSQILFQGDKESVEPKISGAVKARCCDSCPNLKRCEGKASRFTEQLDGMVAAAIASGRAAQINDIPDSILAFCTKPAQLLAAVGEVRGRYKEIEQRAELDRAAKKVVSAQLLGVSKILKNLGDASGEQLIGDMDKERILTEELNYNGIVCVQSVIAGGDIVLIVRSECLESESIEKVVSKLMRRPYKIGSVDDTVIAGFLAVALTPAPKFDMVFGVANAPKPGFDKSGDTHSFIKLDESRFMIALCDGMGSGGKAHEEASAAISLVENFYKAGFDNELVLNSVNNFLTMTASEFFSALDICVVDLNSARADIIKLGAPSTYIRKKDSISRVDGSGLPLGAIEDVSPSVFSVDLALGDIVVMSSDGVSDSFEGDKLAAAVLNLRTLNPQTVAEGVLEHTFSNNKGVLKDDSTVIAAKLIER